MCRFRVLQNGGIREIVVSHFLAQTLNRGVEDIKKVVLRFNSFFLSFFLSLHVKTRYKLLLPLQRTSVTTFGNILPLWQNVKSIWALY